MILSLGFYFPLTVYLGGWDKNSIRDFEKVYQMAGPSKFLVYPMARAIFKSAKSARLHNRFLFDSTEAEREIAEILAVRTKSRQKMQEEEK